MSSQFPIVCKREDDFTLKIHEMVQGSLKGMNSNFCIECLGCKPIKNSLNQNSKWSLLNPQGTSLKPYNSDDVSDSPIKDTWLDILNCWHGLVFSRIQGHQFFRIDMWKEN